jgi:hypothetical protein
MVQRGQAFRLLLCKHRQAKQQFGMNPGLEASPHCDVSHTGTLFKQLVHGLAVSWFYSARDSKYRRLSDKKFIGPMCINNWVVNICY